MYFRHSMTRIKYDVTFAKINQILIYLPSFVEYSHILFDLMVYSSIKITEDLYLVLYVGV